MVGRRRNDEAGMGGIVVLSASSPEELAELPNGGSEEDVDIKAEEEEVSEQVQEFGPKAAEGGEDSLVEEEHEEENGAKEEEEEADDESENLKFSAQLGEDVPKGEQSNGQELAGRENGRERRFFGDRIISQGDSTRSTMKDLDVVLGAESAVVILDDTEGVWPKHRAKLVLMERYHFFRSSCRQFGVRGLSLTEKGRDESEKEEALAMALQRLRRVHDAVFSAANPIERGISKKTAENVDVRNVIQSLKGKVLNGCQVVFSRIFPIGMPYREGHAFWRLIAQP
ncbi:unnamed protein product [Calypogeia fissa]